MWILLSTIQRLKGARYKNPCSMKHKIVPQFPKFDNNRHSKNFSCYQKSNMIDEGHPQNTIVYPSFAHKGNNCGVRSTILNC